MKSRKPTSRLRDSLLAHIVFDELWGKLSFLFSFSLFLIDTSLSQNPEFPGIMRGVLDRRRGLLEDGGPFSGVFELIASLDTARDAVDAG